MFYFYNTFNYNQHSFSKPYDRSLMVGHYGRIWPLKTCVEFKEIRFVKSASALTMGVAGNVQSAISFETVRLMKLKLGRSVHHYAMYPSSDR